MSETYKALCPACRASLSFETELERTVYSTEPSECPGCKAALIVCFHPPDLGGPAAMLRSRYEEQAPWLELAWEQHRQGNNYIVSREYFAATLPESEEWC